MLWQDFVFHWKAYPLIEVHLISVFKNIIIYNLKITWTPQKPVLAQLVLHSLAFPLEQMNYGLFSPAVRTIEGQRKPSHTQNNHPKQQLEIKLNHRELRLIDTLEKVRTKSASFSCIVKIEVNRVIYISTTNPVQFCQFSAFLSCVYKQHIYIFTY